MNTGPMPGVFKQVGDTVEVYEHGATKPFAVLRRVKDKDGHEFLEMIEAHGVSTLEGVPIDASEKT